MANLDLIARDGLVEKTRDDTGPYLAAALESLVAHPLVGEVRSFGLLAAIELVKDKAGPVLFDPVGEIGVICRDYAINKGLMVRAVRDAMIMSPPLSFERSDIDHMVTILATALDRTYEDTTQRCEKRQSVCVK